MTAPSTKRTGRKRSNPLWDLSLGNSIFFKGLGRHAQQVAAANANYVAKQTGRKFKTMRTAPEVTNTEAQGIWVTRTR